MFESKYFLYGMAHLGHIIGHINNVHRGIEGPVVTKIDAAEKLIVKSHFSQNTGLEARNDANFPMLEDVISMDKSQ